MLKTLVVVCLIIFKPSFSARILFMSLQSTPSAHIWNEALMEGLLDQRKHSVTLLTHNEGIRLKHENLTVLLIEGIRNITSEKFNFRELINNGPIDDITWQWKIIIDLCKHDFKSPVFEKLLTEYKKNDFDLIILDVNNAQCHYPIVDYFGLPPSIGVSPFGVVPFLGEIIGHKTPSYIPFYSLDYTDKMCFGQRIYNYFLQSLEKFFRWYYMKEANKLAETFFKSYIGDHVRKLEEIEGDISLLLSNNDAIFDYPEPYGPNIVPVGLLHIKEPTPLSQELQKIFDGSDSVIYFSLGTNVLSDNVGGSILNHFAEAFSRINETVLWKLDDASNLKLSKNVYVRKWFPQNDILANRKLSMFITHCGRMGAQEAVNYGVPIVGIPLALDTRYVAGKLKSVQAGIILDAKTLNSDVIHRAIVEILRNPKYKENMLKLSKRCVSKPYKPLEKALDSIDYVLKVGHTDYLSTANRYMCWYQEDNLDIHLIVFIVIFALTYLISKVITTLRSRLIGLCYNITNKTKTIKLS